MFLRASRERQVTAEELNIRGLTGVAVALRIAGPGTRAYAYIIDWHIRALLAASWVAVGLLIRNVDSSWPLLLYGFLVPALVFYLFYHPVLEILMQGRTPGKRMAGARIVTQEGATPGTGALLIRNVFRLIDTLPGPYVVGLVCCFLTAQRVRIGDLAAGTVLVLDEPKAAQSLDMVGALAGTSALDPTTATLVRDLLDRWREMDAREARKLASGILLQCDGELDAIQIHNLDRKALRARLQGLLDGTVPVRGQQAPGAPQTTGTIRVDPGTASQARDLLGRWPQMDAEQAAGQARNILARLDGELDPVQTRSLDAPALRARLEKLVAGP